MRVHRRFSPILIAIALSGLLLAAACGGDDDAPAPTPDPTPAATEAPALRNAPTMFRPKPPAPPVTTTT